MKFFLILPILFLSLVLGGCSIPFIGGDEPAEYREVFSIAKVSRTTPETVEFEVTGHRNVELPRSEVPSDYAYPEGAEFYVRQLFLKDGKGDPYMLEILRRVEERL